MGSLENIQSWTPVATELFAWFWNNYGNTLAKNAIQSAWNNFDHAKSASKYSQKIEKLYGTMRILGKSDPIAVSDIYTDLSILDKSTAELRYDPENLNRELWNRKSTQRDANRIDGMQMVNEVDYLFILGRPGAGKSTFLRHVALEALRGEVFLKHETITKEKKKGRTRVEEIINVKITKLLPILIELRDFAVENISLFSYIAKQFDVCDFPNAKNFLSEVLKEGRLIILFDGLDEVPKEQNQMERVSKEIEDFTKKYNKNKYIMTCRIATTDYKFSRFTYVELAEFSNSQAKEFSKKWFDHKPRLRNSFWRDLDENDNVGLLEMTRNPLLLTLLCLNYESTQSFPQRRVEIYEEALDALLKTWDAERGITRTGTKLSSYGKLSLGYKKEMFAELAFSGFEKNRLVWEDNDLANWLATYVATIPPQQDKRNIDGFQILKDIESQHAILVESAKKQYSFAHLTFQEYYTANYIVTAGIPAYKAFIYGHLEDAKWREVFLLASSKMSIQHADEFFRLLVEHLNDLKSQSADSLKLLDWIKKKIKSSEKNEAESLAVRNFLLLLYTSFHREHKDEVLDLEYFCKLYGFADINSYPDLLFNSFFGQKLKDKNFDLFFECGLAVIYKLAVSANEVQDKKQTFMEYYYLISSIVDELSKQSLSHGKKNLKVMKDVTNKSREGKFRDLQELIDKFLHEQRNWRPMRTWNRTKLLYPTMLCVECLNISRVSDRISLHKELLN